MVQDLILVPDDPMVEYNWPIPWHKCHWFESSLPLPLPLVSNSLVDFSNCLLLFLCR